MNGLQQQSKLPKIQQSYNQAHLEKKLKIFIKNQDKPKVQQKNNKNRD